MAGPGSVWFRNSAFNLHGIEVNHKRRTHIIIRKLLLEGLFNFDFGWEKKHDGGGEISLQDKVATESETWHSNQWSLKPEDKFEGGTQPGIWGLGGGE